MYSIFLAAALTAGTTVPQSACYGCAGALNCGGSYSYDLGCLGCNLPWGTGYGAYGYGGAFGCAGGAYACMGCYGGYGSWWGTAGGYSGYDAHVGAPVQGDHMAAAPATKPVAKAAPATVVVRLPAGAKLSVEAKPVLLDPATNSFTTPALAPGVNYVYTVTAEVVRNGQSKVESREVNVAAGGVAQVRFDEPGNVVPVVAKQSTNGPSSRITVRLPADARLYINGVECPLTSDVRTFDTPPLEAGRQYTYTLRADLIRDGQPITASKVLVFRPGEPISVDFGDMQGRAVRR